MVTVANAVAFFDIGNTLASVRVSAAGDSIAELNVFPDVLPVLEALRREGVRLGILSNRGPVPEQSINDALERAGLLSFFERQFILYGPKETPRLFEQAAARVRQSGVVTGGARTTLLFVGEDASERAQARAADFLVAPHPRLALTVLEQQGPLRFMRVRVPPSSADADWRAALRSLPLVPLHVSFEPGTATPTAEVFAIADAATASRLDDLGFWVDRLGAEDEPLTTDLYILRDDRQAETGFLSPEGSSFDFFHSSRLARRVLASTHEGLLVSVPAGRSVESLHFERSLHGHNLKLVPSTTLLEPPSLEENPRLSEVTAAAPALFDSASALEAAFAPLVLTPEEEQPFREQFTAELLTRDVARYTDVQPVAGTTRIISRHIHHPDNRVAVGALVADLTSLGGSRLTVRTHRFTHEGHPYDNVEAVLPASGLGGIVMVTAHMDSTGARAPGYSATLDAAPGADDDGSGIAGVLASARAMLDLDAALGVPRREMRFVLFNAEEHGLVGSRAYAREQGSLATRIVAVFQLDMIGFDADAARTFELHVGFTPSPSVQNRSARLAQLVTSLVPQVSPGLPPPQLHPGPGARPTRLNVAATITASSWKVMQPASPRRTFSPVPAPARPLLTRTLTTTCPPTPPSTRPSRLTSRGPWRRLPGSQPRASVGVAGRRAAL